MADGSRLYRWLLRLYPAAFRDEYGEEMAWAFASRRAEEPAWRLWPRTLAETLRTAAREHAEVTCRDVRVALRSLARTPTLAAVVILVLALGIGGTTAVYTVVRHVLWEPLPYHAPERLVVVLQDGRAPIAPGTLEEVRSEVDGLSDVAGAELWGPTWTGAAHPERLAGMRVTANMFRVLGVPPAHGRTPAPGDSRVLVISHRLWHERFGGDLSVLGREIVLDGDRHTIIGVMPPAFVFSPFWARAEAWGVEDLSPRRDDRRGASWRAFARLRDGVSLDAAQQQVDALSTRLAQRHPEAYRQLQLRAISLQDRVTGDVRPLLWTVLVAAGCVLLVTCANVASLLLARASARQQEMAVRSALGGRSGTITRQLLTESLLLASVGALAGLVLAAWLVSNVPSLAALGLPRLDAVTLDARMIAVAALLSVCTGVLFGLAPVWSIRRSLRMGTRGSTDTPASHRARALLVIGEVVVALVLVVGAGLLVRSFVRLATIDPGFRPEGVVAIEISAMSSPTGRANRGPLFTQVVERVRAVPEVTAASLINHAPIAGDAWGVRVRLAEGTDGQRLRAVWRVSSPGLFDTLRVPLRRGRAFTDADVLGATPVVIVSERFVRSYLPPGDPIGRRLTLSEDDELPEWRTIVGVIADVRQQEWAAPADPELHLPLAQTPPYLTAPRAHLAAMTLVARGRGEALALAPPIVEAIRSVDSDLALSAPVALDDAVARQVWRPRVAGLLMSGFALLAMLLAATGLYGLLAHDVQRRSREIGVRLALGAAPGAVRRLLVRRGMRLVGTGLGVGLAVAWAASARMEHLLYDVAPRDVLVFGTAAALFVVVGWVASSVPAWRATRTVTARALRGE